MLLVLIVTFWDVLFAEKPMEFAILLKVVVGVGVDTTAYEYELKIIKIIIVFIIYKIFII